MVETCPACDEALDRTKATVQFNGKDYHTECIDSKPRITPRTLHRHILGWGERVIHSHAGGRDEHFHKEHPRRNPELGGREDA